MKFRKMLMASSVVPGLFLLSVAAKAQPVTGPYVSAGVGYNVMNGRETKGYAISGVETNLHERTLFKNGFTGEASVGYGFGNGFRVELEGDYFDNQAHKVDSATGQVPASGTERKYGAMLNGLYDFDISSPYIYPFIGAGVGYQFLDLRNVKTPTNGAYINSTPGAFAYQAIVGLSFPIPGAIGLSATVQYRYLATVGNEHYKGTEGGVPATFKVGPDSNNMLLVGLNYELFAPMPPAPPAPTPTPVAAPAPAPARTYLVFFDWDSADLSDRARQTIAEAATASTHIHYTRIEVDGYTDRSGSPRYNEKLSLKRAHTVAAELVRNGVPQSVIDVQGFGENHPLVPTASGVREPQNRRVEIVVK
jgi:outer membrane protein OmpA-like peptidoglycan-associated protein/outer membrane protein W